MDNYNYQQPYFWNIAEELLIKTTHNNYNKLFGAEHFKVMVQQIFKIKKKCDVTEFSLSHTCMLTNVACSWTPIPQTLCWIESVLRSEEAPEMPLLPLLPYQYLILQPISNQN